jgi:hypothetical protein
MAPCLTEAVQSRLLLSLYAVFSGDTKDVVSAIERSGFWATVYGIIIQAASFQLTLSAGISPSSICFEQRLAIDSPNLVRMDHQRDFETVRIPFLALADSVLISIDYYAVYSL